MANLLSIPQLEHDGFKVQYHTGGQWIVTCPDNTDVIFKCDTGVTDGFPYVEIDTLGPKQATALMQTVCKNYEEFTKKEVEHAILAHKAQLHVGNQSEKQCKEMVSSPNLENCPVTATDVSNAHVIFGPDLPGVKGKTVHRSPHRVEMEYLEIPHDYYTLQKFITLTADVMFVNGIPFLTTLSRKIRLVTAEYLPTWMAKQLGSSLTKVVNLYAQ